jgi:hypothetical protein
VFEAIVQSVREREASPEAWTTPPEFAAFELITQLVAVKAALSPEENAPPQGA